MTRTLLAVLAIMAAGQAHAYCIEPTSPYCADGMGSFNDEFEFNSCKYDMERYERDVNDYLQCLQDDLENELRRINDDAQSQISRAADTAQDEAESAISEYQDAVDSFNQRAGG